MADRFTVPDEFEIPFRRVLPYLAAPIQKNPQVLESLLLFLKLGGEKMARIAIDALNVTQRLQDAEFKKQLREQELLNGEGFDDSENDEDDDQDDQDAAGDEDDEGFDDEASD